METWKLSIKLEKDSFQKCKDLSLIGIGWSKAYDENDYISSFEQVKEKILSYKKWNLTDIPYAIRYLLNDVKTGDHVWIHQEGKFYLCKVLNDEIVVGKNITSEFKSFDLGHARRAKWINVPDSLISGSIQRGTIAQRIIQRINVSDREADAYEILFQNIERDKDWRPNIADEVLKTTVHGLSKTDIDGILSPDDYEDIIAAYLQLKDWVLIKSTCFRSKPKFEFSMLNKDGQYAHVQVKSGNTSLNIDDYSEWLKKGDEIYLFSSGSNPYYGTTVKGINAIHKEEIFEWIKNNIWALSGSLRMRLSFFASK